MLYQLLSLNPISLGSIIVFAPITFRILHKHIINTQPITYSFVMGLYLLLSRNMIACI